MEFVRFYFNPKKKLDDLIKKFGFTVDDYYHSVTLRSQSFVGTNFIDVDIDDRDVSIQIHDPNNSIVIFNTFYDLVKQGYILKEIKGEE